jgi:NAD(P)-dependent dehydrogenase (short-subunit alcohol dehydrogenase family)
MELEGKVALVTGASGGIGAAVARALHEAGASVGLLSRRGDDLGLERGLGLACDVRDRDAVSAATDAVVERFGRLDIVVANAGVGAYGSFLELDPDQLEAMIDVNLKGTLYTAAAALPHLVAAGGGDFVALASVAGLRAFPGEAVYNASKFGQLGFTRPRPRAARARGAGRLHLSRRREDGLRDRDWPGGGRPGARGSADRGRGGRRRALHSHAAARHAHPDDELPSNDRGVMGMSAGA